MRNTMSAYRHIHVKINYNPVIVINFHFTESYLNII